MAIRTWTSWRCISCWECWHVAMLVLQRWGNLEISWNFPYFAEKLQHEASSCSRWSFKLSVASEGERKSFKLYCSQAWGLITNKADPQTPKNQGIFRLDFFCVCLLGGRANLLWNSYGDEWKFEGLPKISREGNACFQKLECLRLISLGANLVYVSSFRTQELDPCKYG